MATVSVLRPAVGRVKHGEKHRTLEESHQLHNVIVTLYDTTDIARVGDTARAGKEVDGEMSINPGDDLTASDRVAIDGQIFRIEGKILRMRNDLTGTEFRPRVHLVYQEG
ncbi:hypothetical protein SEA_MOLLYMUR_21 [Gordonia phage Mollymur]|uniref:Head-to-tail stopper n=1 Tax=Gordonia phage Mollymur TaxID=2590895 RepID=A0A4Y6EBC2_9CAUD|nr:head closure Hc1 [Gordonia phage Mollymur]QDF15382.1 hypothetical protein SEA_MOLLYMUR_21 [Gordonia phage Mollymur]